MTPFPLTTLLALRQREEEAAEAEWAAAVTALRAAEARLAALSEQVAAARHGWDEARGAGEPVGERVAAGDVTGRQRFVDRRRDEWKAATAAETAFRAGPMVEARRSEAAARATHAEKRRGREAVQKQKEQWSVEAERQAERRAEDARDDLTAAARHQRRNEK